MRSACFSCFPDWRCSPGGKSIRQTIFYPFQQVSKYGRGTVLEPRVLCPEFRTAKYGAVPRLQVAPVVDPEKKSLNVFVLNCGENPLTTELVFRGYKEYKAVAYEVLTGDDLNAVNSLEKPHQVGLGNAQALPEEREDSSFRTELPGYSWNRVQFVQG